MKKPTLLQSGNIEKKQKELLEKDPKEPKLDPLDAEDFHNLRGKHRIKTVVISFKAKGTEYRLRFEKQENTKGSLMMLLEIPLSEIEEKTREFSHGLDELIRKERINVQTATSLMNDISYCREICWDLVEAGSVLFSAFDLDEKTAARSIALGEDEIIEMVEDRDQEVTQ